METFDIIVNYLEKAGLTYRQTLFLLGEMLWEELPLISRNERKIIETINEEEA